MSAATPRTIILLGRSGSGKGTQANLLLQYFQSQATPEACLYIETGGILREFIKSPGWTQEATKAVMHSGGYLPAFMAIRNWTEFLIKNYQGGQNLIFDGTPRTLVEAEALDGALGFYERQTVPLATVFLLEVPEEEIVRRLLPRGRADDTPESINNRLAEFDKKVKPVIDYYNGQPNYRFVRLDGHRAIEEIHQDIVSHLS